MFINKTKAKIILSAVITIVILNYIIGLSGKPFLFIVFLPIISLILLIPFSIFWFFLIEYLIWRLTPHRITENFLIPREFPACEGGGESRFLCLPQR